MLHFSRWKTTAICLVSLIGLLGSIPNFFDKARVLSWPFPFNKSMNLGLDLQGGAHFLLGIDTSVLRRDWLENIRDEARQKLRTARVQTTGIGIAEGRVRVTLANAADADNALKELRTVSQQLETASLTGISTQTLDVRREDGGVIVLQPTEPGIRERESKGIGAAIETIRRRLDPEGTREMTIVRQGRDRILVQIPGVEDPALVEEYKQRIKAAAKMTFHLVHPTMTADDAKQGRAPPGYKIYQSSERVTPEELLEERAILGGDQLADAQPGFDQRTNEPIISFRFNQSGARIFGRTTQENVNRRFAIVLDNRVISAPVIREPILGGTGQISGNFSVEEANRLAVLLRSGALPAPLSIVEERTVGPSLGADSIQSGKIATIIGTILVIAFMLFAYGLFGVFAIAAVAVNIAIIVAVMGWIGSSLTLPGIAGILLTIGMAVDANVLIYERIREELRNKSTPIAAIEKGFDRAFATIVDANLTTLIAGIVMFWLGSGPIKGFAVTLSLGVITTVFTAFTVTRMLVSWWLAAQKTKKIEAPL
ncbi:MAG: protein translocase subunit SecD [Hyphomicrobiales bacterium]|nr:protein translocase subunit SecD [Hyphomicrobiales bacterium]